MAVRLIEEVQTGKYAIIDIVSVDWCPCCGVNLRMRCEHGSLLAKFIAKSPAQARELAAAIVAQADQMEHLCPNGLARLALSMGVREAATCLIRAAGGRKQ